MRGLLPLGLLLGLIVPAACTNPVRRISESSLRNATARGATEEMRGLGYYVRQGLRCRTLTPDTLSVIKVRCVGRTTDDEPVRVDAVASDAASRHPRQEFVITVGGHQLLRTSCLGRGCEDRHR